MKYFSLFLFAITLVFLTGSVTFSISPEQRRVIDSGSLYFNLENTSFGCAAPSNTNSSTLESGSSVYILGDSITVLSQAELEGAILSRGYEISKINADSGRAISTDTAGSGSSGLEAVTEDLQIINTSDAVIIALGTNSGIENLSEQIPELISTIRDTGFAGVIYWINLFSGSETTERNATIQALAAQQNYNVIDTTLAEIQLDAEGIHPEGPGKAVLAGVVVDGLQNLQTSGGLVPANSVGNCTCGVGVAGTLNTSITWNEGVWGAGSEIYVSGIERPQTIEQWAIHVLKNISRKSGVVESEMVTQKKVVSLVAWARSEGGGVDGHVGTFNPLNTKGGSGTELGGANQGNAATDSNSNGFPTFDKGVEGITRGLFNQYQKRIGSYLLLPDSQFSGEEFIEVVAGDFYSENGSDVINRLEDVYPGDGIWAAASATGLVYDPQNGGTGDREKYVELKRSVLRDVWEGGYEAYASKVLEVPRGVIPPGTPAPLQFSPNGPNGSSFSGGSCQQAGGANVNTDGYAFPLEPQTKSGVSGISEGQIESTHWDGTDAFDLFSSDSADVYAIHKGVPITINTNFNGVPGCGSIQFQAADGFYYWYGHLKNIEVQEGVEIQAGTKMAEVADISFGTDCTGNGGPHLHIDRGCTIDGTPERGGTKACRDPEFIPFLSKIYEELPLSEGAN